MNKLTADIIVDLQYGDCAKGKITHHLLKSGEYTHVLRYNGGGNAGHTIYHEGKKFVTHYIPAGVFFGIPSIIGPGCVLNAKKFLEEIEELKSGGLTIEKSLIQIAKNTHITTDAHIVEDSKDAKIGTTKSGNGPTYRDKYARTGIRAEDVPELSEYIVDLYDVLHKNGPVTVMCEGAQGFGLDIDWGDYPYVTSSHATAGGALLNGVPFSAVRDVWGAAKIYETYVGAKEYQPKDEVFNEIARIGEEFGATTGRQRQCNWLNWNLLEQAVRMNGVTHIVLSKMDVLREVGQWAVLKGDPNAPEGARVKEKIEFKSEDEMKEYLTEALVDIGLIKENIHFSEHKDRI